MGARCGVVSLPVNVGDSSAGASAIVDTKSWSDSYGRRCCDGGFTSCNVSRAEEKEALDSTRGTQELVVDTSHRIVSDGLDLGPRLRCDCHGVPNAQADDNILGLQKEAATVAENMMELSSVVSLPTLVHVVPGQKLRLSQECWGASKAHDTSDCGACVEEAKAHLDKKQTLQMEASSPKLCTLPLPVPPPTPMDEAGGRVFRQQHLGPQSKRGEASQFQLDVLSDRDHAKQCFEELAQREKELCGEWAVFYHSYTEAALLYEVQAAVAKILYGFPNELASLPRIRQHEFSDIPDAPTLKERFRTEFSKFKTKDHHDDFRAVAISVMCSLVSLGPEVSPPVCFVMGYNHSDDPVDLRLLIESILVALVTPKEGPAPWTEAKNLVDKIITLAERFNLDVANFGGKHCASKMSGHLLQMFVRRDLLGHLSYASQPWGWIDEEREPIENWLNEDSNTSYGQARVVVNPEYFVRTDCVRSYLASADPEFHRDRREFQTSLTDLLVRLWLPEASLRGNAEKFLREGPAPSARMSAAPKVPSSPSSRSTGITTLFRSVSTSSLAYSRSILTNIVLPSTSDGSRQGERKRPPEMKKSGSSDLVRKPRSDSFEKANLRSTSMPGRVSPAGAVRKPPTPTASRKRHL
eukprot:TRINITY_DN62977_c0_g1_i1.p1 TRINITY_DN62977_c0_g1~~TRINITY_DN62977_c0_g1_i1.p1  ORF type:complete len:638 (-),score=78.15 TRINITY_DN62977_c0_g1_i1:110-2023(-)